MDSMDYMEYWYISEKNNLGNGIIEGVNLV